MTKRIQKNVYRLIWWFIIMLNTYMVLSPQYPLVDSVIGLVVCTGIAFMFRKKGLI